MNKNELLEKVSSASGLSKKQSEAAINAFLDTLTDVLKAGDKISLKGFGTFEVRTREQEQDVIQELVKQWKLLLVKSLHLKQALL